MPHTLHDPRISILARNIEVDDLASQAITDVVNARADARLGLATGSTPIGVYDRLAAAWRDGKVSFSQVHTFNLDEYCGLPSTHPDSFAFYMWHHLFGRTDFDPGKINLIAGDAADPTAEARRYGERFARQKCDLQLLGIGENGHIGFNEPGSPAEGRTRVVRLEPSTRAANQKTLRVLKETPESAITIGIADILQAKSIIVIAKGPAKAEAVRKAIKDRPNSTCPASFLRYHPDVHWMLDADAAGLLGAQA